jgi:hypothetical protein
MHRRLIRRDLQNYSRGPRQIKTLPIRESLWMEVSALEKTVSTAAGVRMSNTEPPTEPTLEEALADVRTLARVALESDDIAVIKRDLEMILTIAEMVLPPRQQ